MPLLCLTGRWSCRRQQRRAAAKDEQCQTEEPLPVTSHPGQKACDLTAEAPHFPGPPPPTPVPSRYRNSLEYIDQDSWPTQDLGSLVLDRVEGLVEQPPGSRMSYSSPNLPATYSSHKESDGNRSQERPENGGFQFDWQLSKRPDVRKHSVYHKNSYMVHVSRRRPYCRHGFQGYLQRSSSASPVSRQDQGEGLGLRPTQQVA